MSKMYYMYLPFVQRESSPLLGNKVYLHSKKEEQLTPSKRRGGRSESGEPAGMVMHNGAMLDIESLLERLEKGEKSIADYEKRIKELDDDRGMTFDLNRENQGIQSFS